MSNGGRRRRGYTRGYRANWPHVYKDRMNTGLEKCRHCKSVENLTFAHLKPHALGGAFTIKNITILCAPCNNKQGIAIWPHLISLFEEEITSSVEKRWSQGDSLGALAEKVSPFNVIFQFDIGIAHDDY